jgi:hypothetical protein
MREQPQKALLIGIDAGGSQAHGVSAGGRAVRRLPRGGIVFRSIGAGCR